VSQKTNCTDSVEFRIAASISNVTVAACGEASDGCGGLLKCGSCSSGQTCSNFQCSNQCNTRITACPTNACGAIADGCGSTITCPTCTNGFCFNGLCVSCITITLTFTKNVPSQTTIQTAITTEANKLGLGVNNIDITITQSGNTFTCKICPSKTTSSSTVQSNVQSNLQSQGYATVTTTQASGAKIIVASLICLILAFLMLI